VGECLPGGLAMRALQITAGDQMATLTGMNRMQGYNQSEEGQTLDQVRPRLRLCAGSGSNPGGHDRTKSSPPTLANHAAKGSYLGIDLDLEVV
jgi:hypothetical protein